MRWRIAAAALLLFGCGEQGEMEQRTEALSTVDAAQPPGAEAEPAAGQAGPAPPGAVPVQMPRIAYTYGYSFRLPPGDIAAVQERHVALCRRLGPARCRIVDLRRSAEDGAFSSAGTKLQVAAAIPPQFGERLVAVAAEAGADNVGRTIEGEDLSKQMVDAEARIRTRETLIRRLTELLETRSGNIEQAVAAERSITAAQEELEAARGWLAEMRTRVAMSTFDLQYVSASPLGGGAREPIRDAFAQVGSLFAGSVAAMILLIGALLPWLVLGILAFLAVRRYRTWREKREFVTFDPAPREPEGPPEELR